MNQTESIRPVEILLIEDNPGDVRLIGEALRKSQARTHLSVARDGVEAMAFLSQQDTYADAPRPDLILLDLNLPKKDGREVLAEIKQDPRWRPIPVVILTTSDAWPDILRAYDLHANCYITKPVDLDSFVRAIRSVEEFWLTIVRLPSL
jgi:chemotaxis family two-component system response regulator Rcp1